MNKPKAVIFDLDGTLAEIEHRIHFVRDGEKEELYEQKLKPFYDIMFVVDDRQQVVDMWRSKGIVCLQCADGDY